MVGMVENNLIAQEFLELPQKASREAGLLFQMGGKGSKCCVREVGRPCVRNHLVNAV